jgi:hypothetical protein
MSQRAYASRASPNKRMKLTSGRRPRLRPLAAYAPCYPDRDMNVQDAIKQAEALLPGIEAPEGELDPRWQAVIAVAEFIEQDPEAVWTFVARWGQHEDDDLRMAVATCALEHLLEDHFDLFISRVEALAVASGHFCDTVSKCSKFGQSEVPANAARLEHLKRTCRERLDNNQLQRTRQGKVEPRR